jgi:hypothetical protein
LVDWSSELLANAGWLGGVVSSDGHQEAVLPAALLAALVLLGLCVTIALRAGRGDRVRYDADSAAHRVAVGAATLVATFAAIAVMEAYETSFGGVSAFDARSVFVEHAPAIFAAYALVATVVGWLVTRCLNATVAAARLAVDVVVRFLRIDVRANAPASQRDASRRSCIVYGSAIVALGAIALRAPPGEQLSLRQLPT